MSSWTQLLNQPWNIRAPENRDLTWRSVSQVRRPSAGSLIWLSKCQGGKGSLHRVVHRFPSHGEPQEVKRQVEGVISYPAVGMLIFASCPVVANQAGSPSFNSPRPCP